jgi:hypothetical protein
MAVHDDPGTLIAPHDYDDDAVCVICGFDAAEWSHWKRNTYEGKASSVKTPLCKQGSERAAILRANCRWSSYRESA